MKVRELAEKECFKIYGDDEALDREIKGVFVGDLLSWVMGNCEPDNVWITVQTHLNVIAVASLKEISCIIIVQGAEIPEETINKAKEEHIALLVCEASAYETALICHQAGC